MVKKIDNDMQEPLLTPLPLKKQMSIRYTNAYLPWAFGACLFFGTSNFLSGDLSGRLGPAGGYTFFIGNIIGSVLYHGYTAYKNKQENDVYFSRETSMYYDFKEDKISKARLLGPFLRGICQLATFFSVFMTF
jgi:drug/metabolite transporter (DMT)-like permease